MRVIGKSRSSVAWSLIQRGGYIYKIDRGGITRLPVRGGEEEVVYDRRSGRQTREAGGFTEDPYFADVMTVSPDGTLMWLTVQASGGLLEIRNNTGTVRTLTSAERTSDFGHMIAGHHNVYWIEPQSGSLKTVPIHGGKVSVISSRCDDPEHFVQHDNYIFFKTLEGLMRASKVDFKTSSVGKLPSTISSLGVDESHVYYASWSPRTPSTGFIGELPKKGGASEVVLTGLKSPGSLAIDRDYVYFTDGEDKIVARVPRRVSTK